MSIDTPAVASSGPLSRRGLPAVVVGVDGSRDNGAAVQWAAHEAKVAGRPLLMVGVGAGGSLADLSDTGDEHPRHLHERMRALLEVHGDGEGLARDDVSVRVVLGEPSRALVRAASGQALLVVGKRGVGPLERAVLGSTSIAVAGRSSVSVVVVPDEWSAATAVGGPIVVGVDGTERDTAVLDLAFARARALDVPLEVVCAWQVPPLYEWSVEDVARWEATGRAQLTESLRPLAARFPDVVVRPSAPTVDPAVGLLAVAGPSAQLLVLGRHSGPRHPGGLSLGATARRVLHHSRCPVAVVVVGAGAEGPGGA